MLTKPHKMMAAPSKMRYPHRLMYIDIYKNAVLYSKKFQSSNARLQDQVQLIQVLMPQELVLQGLMPQGLVLLVQHLELQL